MPQSHSWQSHFFFTSFFTFLYFCLITSKFKMPTASYATSCLAVSLSTPVKLEATSREREKLGLLGMISGNYHLFPSFYATSYHQMCLCNTLPPRLLTDRLTLNSHTSCLYCAPKNILHSALVHSSVIPPDVMQLQPLCVHCEGTAHDGQLPPGS